MMGDSPAQQVAFNSEWQRLNHLQNASVFPVGDAKQRDSVTNSCGLVRGYELRPEPTSGPTELNSSTSNSNKIHPRQPEHLPTIEMPSLEFFIYAAKSIVEEPFFALAYTILVITDTDALSSSRIQKHFDKIGPILFDRTTIQGPFGEQWAVAFQRTNQHDQKIHCTWSAVFLIEALATTAPWKHYVLQDHDDTPTSLFEVQQLVNLVNTFHLPYFTSKDAHPGMLIQNEESTPGNAGQVIFATRNTRKETAIVSPQQIFEKLQHERSQIVSRKFQAPRSGVRSTIPWWQQWDAGLARVLSSIFFFHRCR
jgi:hypothetical protein